jgi:glycerate dehydrogenase
MKVIAYDAYPAKDRSIEYVPLNELFERSDVISLHCPLTPDTREFINASTLRLVKPTAILINTGRGPLINEQAVADALNEGRLYAYCADVLETEPPQADNVLLLSERAFITPHVAWASLEARKRLLQVVTDNVEAFINGCPVNVVNK